MEDKTMKPQGTKEVKSFSVNEVLFLTRLIKTCSNVMFNRSVPMVTQSGFREVKAVGYDKLEVTHIENSYKKRFSCSIKYVYNKVNQEGKFIKL